MNSTPPLLPTEKRRSTGRLVIYACVSIVCVAITARLQFVATMRETHISARAAGAATSALILPGVVASLFLIGKFFRSLERWAMIYAIVSAMSIVGFLNQLLSSR